MNVQTPYRLIRWHYLQSFQYHLFIPLNTNDEIGGLLLRDPRDLSLSLSMCNLRLLQFVLMVPYLYNDVVRPAAFSYPRAGCLMNLSTQGQLHSQDFEEQEIFSEEEMVFKPNMGCLF